MLTVENILAVHGLTLTDRGIGLKRIAEILMCRIGHEKISAKWVLKCMNADQKRARV